MGPRVRFSYGASDNRALSPLPHLPMSLILGNRSVEVVGLVDSGAMVNVLPYPIGQALGAVWEAQRIRISLTGNLASLEARVLVVFARHPQLTPVAPAPLVFAWTQAENVPV